MKTLFLILFGLVVLIGLYIRFAPSNPQVWHIDPLEAEKPKGARNVFHWRPGEGKYPTPVYEMDKIALAKAFDAHVLRYPNVTRLAGRSEDVHVTYVARTPMVRFPDYVSVSFLDAESGGATLAVYSRSRFGSGDGGLNRTRFLGWVEDFDPS